MPFKVSDTVTLPIGLDWEGTRYKTILLDEMRGFDEEALSNPRNRTNPIQAMDLVLRRCILAIPGLLEAKKADNTLIDEKIVKAMYVPDRDFLFAAIRCLSMEPVMHLKAGCPNCKAVSDLDVPLESLDFNEFEDSGFPTIKIELPVGLKMDDGSIRNKGIYNTPTGATQTLLAAKKDAEIPSWLIHYCFRLDGIDKAIPFEIVRSMRTRDRLHLLNTITEFTPGLDLRVEHVCAACGTEFIHKMELSSFFTGPSGGMKKRFAKS